MSDPSTLEQWQFAAQGAAAMLLMESARAYGLMKGGPTVNVKRCEEILERARIEHGIEISHDEALAFWTDDMSRPAFATLRQMHQGRLGRKPRLG